MTTPDGPTNPHNAAEPHPRTTATPELAGDIGRRVTANRMRRGMRVTDLAREVGVTPSLISQIERGLARPSVSTLFAMAQAMEIPVDAFFREPAGSAPGRTAGSPGAALRGPMRQATEAEARYVVRHGYRAAIEIEGGVRWERLTPQTLRHLDFFELIYQPGAQSNPTLYTHPGTEMVLVMSGCLEIFVGFDSYRLDVGDSIDFPSSMPHRYLNPGSESARAVTVIHYDCPGVPDMRMSRPL